MNTKFLFCRNDIESTEDVGFIELVFNDASRIELLVRIINLLNAGSWDKLIQGRIDRFFHRYVYVNQTRQV